MWSAESLQLERISNMQRRQEAAISAPILLPATNS
jgi:hypothetical protein